MPDREQLLRDLKAAASIAEDAKIKINYGASRTRVVDELSGSKDPKNILTPEQAEDILNALKAPVVAGADRGNRPNLTIQVEVDGQRKPVEVFRRERDGRVSLNEAYAAPIQEGAKQVDLAQPEGRVESPATGTLTEVKAKRVRLEGVIEGLDTIIQSGRTTLEVNQLFSRLKQEFSRELDQYRDRGLSLVAKERALKAKTLDTIGKVQDEVGRISAVSSEKLDHFNRSKAAVNGQLAHFAESSAERIGERAKAFGGFTVKLGQRIEKVGQWLQDRPQAIRNHKTVVAAIEAFERGQERLPSDSYRLNDRHFISREVDGGKTTYYVSEVSRSGEDAKGLLSFSRDDAGKITDIAQYSAYDYETVKASLSADIPRADPSQEQIHLRRSEQVAIAARAQLELETQLSGQAVTHVNKKRYVIAVDGERLTVQAKDGRGVVLETEGSAVVQSKLNQEDFRRFAPIVKHLSQAPSHAQQHEEVAVR